MSDMADPITVMMVGLGISAAGSIGTGIAEAVTAPGAPTAPSASQTATEQANAAQAAAQAQAAALTKRRGMASTVMTSPMGAPTAQGLKATLGA